MNTVSTSEIFGFLGKHQDLTIEKHIIISSEFSLLRRSIRRIVFMLRDSDEESTNLAAAQLRRALSEWLTVPVPFDENLQTVLEENLGAHSSIQRRWGADLAECFETAWVSSQSLCGNENPIRASLLKQIRNLRVNHCSFRIFCNRRAREHFESIIDIPNDPPLQPADFLHTVVDYEAAHPADALIKVGPLRATGWGKVPDAIINAPKFLTIHQFVWPACGDDEDFGFDAASAELPSKIEDNLEAKKPEDNKSGFVWYVKLPEGEPPKQSGLGAEATANIDEDDLLLFREAYRSSDRCSALLVQLDQEHGVLYPRFSQVLSFDPHAVRATSIRSRSAWEGLREGMFVIFPIMHDVDLGELQAEHGYFSRVWRERLKQEWLTNPDTLLQRLQIHGLSLIHLPSAIRHWIAPPDTVIHAPQSLKHFRVLMKILNCEEECERRQSRRGSRPFWEEAWLEVRRSRGEAIQAGFQEQEIVEEEITKVLKSMLPEIEGFAENKESFLLAVPKGRGIHGFFQFYRIQAIDDGYLAPHSDFKVIRELNELDIWRE